MKFALVVCTVLVVAASTTNAFIPVSKAQSHRTNPTFLSAIKESTFGMGCFWKPSEELLKVPGVVDTVAGYTGKADATDPPSYENVCFGRDWVEGVRVYYDDEQVTYAALLDAFFETQEPQAGSRQYSSIVFPHDEEQQEVATQWLQENKKRSRKDGVTGQWTELEPLSNFYRAEGYHQQYWQKTRPRIASMIALLAISTGVLDDFTPETYQRIVHEGCNIAVLLGLVLVVAERKLDTKTVQL